MEVINESGEETTKKTIESIADITNVGDIVPRDGEKVIGVIEMNGYLYTLKDGLVRFRDLNEYWKDRQEKDEKLNAFYESIRPVGK